MPEPLSTKQVQFIREGEARWNLAHGAVRTGKTVGTLFKFMVKAATCPDSKIYIVGHTFDTAYRNVVRLIMETDQLAIFRPFCTWSGKKLYYRDKVITVLGAKDEGAIGNFQGDTHSLTYCDEITLYPESIIDMIDTRLSCQWSQAYATMNPSHPTHKVKQWIDKAVKGDPNYYQMHFTLDDNPYVPEDYKQRIRSSLSGVFYKRIGVSTGRYTQTGKVLWVENEYYWNPKETQRQKTNSEFCKDVVEFLQDYNVTQLYIDPSAAAFKTELRRAGLHPIDANNEVLDGIQMMISEMQKGNLFVVNRCTNLIREIETYVWDNKKSERGDDEPVKKDDHAIDALRYAIASHKVSIYEPFKEQERQQEWMRNKYDIHRK